MRMPVLHDIMLPRLRPHLLASLAILAFAACDDNPTLPSSDFDLGPFTERARDADCSEQRNNLYLVDKALVFWERQGSCADAHYSQTLYGKSVDDIKCRYYDSIAGPQEECNDSAFYDMFETMKSNLDAPDLGLGSGHTVEPIPL
jgi:hypothetical protein